MSRRSFAIGTPWDRWGFAQNDMRSFLILALLAAPGAAQTTRQQTETAIQQTVSKALPPEVAARATGGNLNQFLSSLPPDQRRSALSALTTNEGALGDSAQGALGAAYLNLGDPSRAMSSAERALRANPKDPDALAVKARVLASRGGKSEAQTLLAQIPADQRARYADAFSAVQLAREGSAGGFSTSGAPPPAGFHASAAGPQPGAAMERFIEKSFARRGESATLDAVIRKVDPNARTLGDLKRQGIGLGVDPAIKDAVELVDRDGKKTLMFNPSVFEGPRDSRGIAQVGRALEEFVADRDHDGLSAWFRKLGGRVTAVRIYFELDPNDKATTAPSPADQRLIQDRGAATANAATQISYPNMQGLAMISSVKDATAAGDSSDVGILIQYAARGDKMSAPPTQNEVDSRYLNGLRPRRQ